MENPVNVYRIASLVVFATIALSGCDGSQAEDVGSWVVGFDQSIPRKSAGDIPALNEAFANNYGQKIRRVSAPNAVSSTWVRHEYSRRQPFNADGSRMAMIGDNGVWHLYEVGRDDTVKWIDRLPSLREPNWHPDDPRRLWFFDHAGSAKIQELDVESGEIRTVADLSGRLPWPAERLSTREEGEPSDDGRIWCLFAQTRDFKTLGMFAYDLERDEILGTQDLEGQPDHISTSPRGRYCVPSGAEIDGTWAYSLDFEDRRKLYDGSEHSDLAIDMKGNEVLVYADYGSGWISMSELETGDTTRLVPIYEKRGSAYAAHISGNAVERPGHVVVSTYGATLDKGARPADYGDIWGHDRLAIIELRRAPRVFNVAYMNNHRTDYWSEPHATVNRDLTRIVFASNWQGSGAPNAYMVSVDPSELHGDRQAAH